MQHIPAIKRFFDTLQLVW